MEMQSSRGDKNLLASFFRGLPDFRGKRRIGRYLFQQQIKEGRDLIVSGKGQCIYKLPNLSDSLALDIFVNGIYEEETHDFLIERIPRGAVFMDLGANIGSIVIPLCKKREDISAMAVEAAPWIYEYLQFNIQANGLDKRIKAINKAISDTDGEPLPFYSPRDQFGKGSLSPVFTDNAIMIDRTTIDSMLTEVAVDGVHMIKIDIEGFEYFAFKGGVELLKSVDAPEIIFEFVDWAEERANLKMGTAQEFLQQLGFKLYLMEGKDLKAIEKPITTGGSLIFATKRNL
jgi:FkbM family methyltransferase